MYIYINEYIYENQLFKCIFIDKDLFCSLMTDRWYIIIDGSKMKNKINMKMKNHKK